MILRLYILKMPVFTGDSRENVEMYREMQNFYYVFEKSHTFLLKTMSFMKKNRPFMKINWSFMKKSIVSLKIHGELIMDL